MRVLSPLLVSTLVTSAALAAPSPGPTTAAPPAPLPATVTALAKGAQIFPDLGVLTVSEAWRAAALAVRKALQASGLAAESIAAVGFSGQMHGALLLDDADAVIRPAIR